MLIPNWLYDLLKTMGTVILPALAVCYQKLAETWGWPYSEQVPQTIMTIVVMLNSCLGISSSNYYKMLADNIRVAEGTQDVEDINHQVGGNDSIEEG